MELLFVGLLTALGTGALTLYFRHVNDAAPFLDAFTTCLSLAAQYLLNGKRVQNWFVWIAADVLYVGLYVQRGLFLTAVLYAGFIGLCVVGYREWCRIPTGSAAAAMAAPARKEEVAIP